MAGNPIFRELYNHTLDTFPSAVYLLCAALLVVASVGNLTIFIKRKSIEMKSPEDSQNSQVGFTNPAFASEQTSLSETL